jgi:hypothetical protein
LITKSVRASDTPLQDAMVRDDVSMVNHRFELLTFIATRVAGACLGLLAGWSAGSCDGKAASAVFSSGLDPRKVLVDLDAGEAETLCARARDYTGRQFRITRDQICRFSAEWHLTAPLGDPPSWESDEAVRMACHQLYDPCMRSGEADGGEPPGCETPRACPQTPYRCQATVADLEACGSLMPGFWRDLFSSIPSCDQFSRAVAAQRRGYQAALPAPCKNLESQCADLEFVDLLFHPFAALTCP